MICGFTLKLKSFKEYFGKIIAGGEGQAPPDPYEYTG
jgi:hypothetical protein